MESKTAVVGACDQSKVQELPFRVNYVRITGKKAGDRPSVELVAEVEEKYAALAAADPEVNVEKCDQCGGWSSPADVPEACPYCNDGSAEFSAEATKFVEAEEERMAEEDENEEHAIDSVALERQVAEIKSGEAPPPPEQKMSRRLPATAPRPGAPLVALAGGKSAPNSDELDRAVARYRAAGDTHAGSYYEAGVELNKMVTYSLWQQRLDEKGKQKFKTFDQFMKVELKLSKTTGYRLMAAVRSFTKPEFEKLGWETSAMIAGAPQEMHEQLIQEAQSGATSREMRQSIRDKKEAMGIVTAPPATPGATRTNAATVAAAAKRKEQREEANRAVINDAKERAAITVGLKTNTFTEKMKAKGCLPGQPPAQKGEIRNAVLPDDLAAVLRDLQPYVQVKGVNGVVVTMALVVDSSGQMSLKGDARRVKDEEEEGVAAVA